MTLCSECKAKIPSLSARRNKANGSLYWLGLSYHENKPLQDINDILVANGFRGVDFSFAERNQLVHEEVGDHTWLTVKFYRMDTGRWEVTAYVN